MLSTRNVAILVFDDVEVLDFAGPFEVFNVASELLRVDKFPPFFVYTVGLTGETIVARGNLRVQPHYSIDNCPQADLMIIPGGYGARRLVKHPQLLEWLQAQAAQLEHLMSVCTGAFVLAQAGLLAHLPATTHHTAFDILQDLSPSTTVVRNQRFVDNGSILTSGGISAGIDMSLAVVEQLLGKESADIVRKEMEWNWHQ
jgi:transcriptional regulator GlxA family with amidase domain